MILVTGAAGFIGYHIVNKLLEMGHEVVGTDNLNDYYSPELKIDRIHELEGYSSFKFYKLNLIDYMGMEAIFKSHEVRVVINLAAQVGVRYSLLNPAVYQQSNIEGFLNILELCRQYKVENLIYASSSSVYGKNTKLPFSESDPLEGQISFYGVTKRSNELMAHCYSHLFGLHTTGLRFFTVYGPWGRPDMAIFKFTRAILSGEKLEVYNQGQMKRDFTYIEDIVKGVVACLEHPFPCEIINLGNNTSINLLYFIECLEKVIGKKAEKLFLPANPGECQATFADINKANKLLGFLPCTGIEEGVGRFFDWYQSYFHL